MRKYNDGKSEDNILQNQFTAYLITAVKRRKILYLKEKERRSRQELPLDPVSFDVEVRFEVDFNEVLPLLDQIEDPILLNALLQAKERERYIFLTRAVDERSFNDLSEELGISYKAASNAYYRFLERIRRMMEEGGEKR